MTENLLGQNAPWGLDPWGETTLTPDEVAAVVWLHKLGWGTRRIAGGLGCSRNTAKRYLAAGRLCDHGRRRQLQRAVAADRRERAGCGRVASL